MCTWWYDVKVYKQIEMIKFYSKMSDKSSQLCLSREEDVEGKRVFFIVEIEKFCNFYSGLPNKHYYEIITDKCCLYFDVEYSRKKCYMIKEDYGFELFMKIIEIYLEIEMKNVSAHQIYYLVLDSSNADKFNRHIIIRFLRDDAFTELMFKNNYVVCRQLVYKLRDFLAHVVYKFNDCLHAEILTQHGINEEDMKYLKIYKKKNRSYVTRSSF
ncbi:hypothetical protein TKK_0003469 [Trichogramma kaykai]